MISSARHLLTLLQQAIEPLYGSREAALIARMVLSERSGRSESSLLADPDCEVEVADFESLLEELRRARPVQYVLGHTEFCGLDFRVREGCLIPRPETEELVAHILRTSPPPRRLLDVGTGSGCIALSLKKGLSRADVVAVDLSEEALAIARENGRNLGLEVDFRRADALNLEATLADESFDLIVSNPPYIPQRECVAMRPNVVDYEPHEALFVPDDDPLRFYRAIARSARRLLAPTGSLWFEIHEDFACELVAMLHKEAFTKVEVLMDMNDKARMIWSRR